jgi:hypothetical protein
MPFLSSRALKNLRPTSYRSAALPTQSVLAALFAGPSIAPRPANFWNILSRMATTRALDGPKDYGNFKLLQSFPIKYAPVNVAKWRSEKTGLMVVVGSHQGRFERSPVGWIVADVSQHPSYVPMSSVMAILTFPDEWAFRHRFGKYVHRHLLRPWLTSAVFDDTGRPHTLEQSVSTT